MNKSTDKFCPECGHHLYENTTDFFCIECNKTVLADDVASFDQVQSLRSPYDESARQSEQDFVDNLDE